MYKLIWRILLKYVETKIIIFFRVSYEELFLQDLVIIVTSTACRSRIKQHCYVEVIVTKGAKISGVVGAHDGFRKKWMMILKRSSWYLPHKWIHFC